MIYCNIVQIQTTQLLCRFELLIRALFAYSWSKGFDLGNQWALLALRQPSRALFCWLCSLGIILCAVHTALTTANGFILWVEALTFRRISLKRDASKALLGWKDAKWMSRWGQVRSNEGGWQILSKNQLLEHELYQDALCGGDTAYHRSIAGRRPSSKDRITKLAVPLRTTEQTFNLHIVFMQPCLMWTLKQSLKVGYKGSSHQSIHVWKCYQ